MKTVSIVIPAFNEEAFLGTLLKTIIQVDVASIGFKLEIIVVDDGSTDYTRNVAEKFQEVRYIHQNNGGKGSAVRHGISLATGDYILIQDADLEYNPNDYIELLRPAMDTLKPVAIYGSRVLGEIKKSRDTFTLFPGKHPKKSVVFWFANILLSGWTLILYGKYISDTVTGYKVYPAPLIKKWNLRTSGFETDHELTAKLIRTGIPILEVPVDYNPRTLEEGKKIRASDFFVALWTFLKFRFIPRKDF